MSTQHVIGSVCARELRNLLSRLRSCDTEMACTLARGEKLHGETGYFIFEIAIQFSLHYSEQRARSLCERLRFPGPRMILIVCACLCNNAED